jgi:hypothetical protein
VVALVGGCASHEAPPRLAACAVEAVQISNREPGPACIPLGAAAAHSGEGETRAVPAYATLRSLAGTVGANYVVVDSFAVALDEGWPTTLRGRMFACPLGQPCAAR